MNFIQGYLLLMLLNWWLIEQYSSCLWPVALFTKVWCFHSIKNLCGVEDFWYYTKEFETSKATNTHNILSQSPPQMALCDINHCWSIQTFTVRKHLWKESLPLISLWLTIRSWKKFIIGKKIKRKNGECSGIKRDVRQLPLFWETNRLEENSWEVQKNTWAQYLQTSSLWKSVLGFGLCTKHLQLSDVHVSTADCLRKERKRNWKVSFLDTPPRMPNKCISRLGSNAA